MTDLQALKGTTAEFLSWSHDRILGLLQLHVR